jgi:hypothetical protein
LDDNIKEEKRTNQPKVVFRIDAGIKSGSNSESILDEISKKKREIIQQLI